MNVKFRLHCPGQKSNDQFFLIPTAPDISSMKATDVGTNQFRKKKNKSSENGLILLLIYRMLRSHGGMETRFKARLFQTSYISVQILPMKTKAMVPSAT